MDSGGDVRRGNSADPGVAGWAETTAGHASTYLGRPLHPRHVERTRHDGMWSDATRGKRRLRIGAIVHAYPPGTLAGAERMLESILEWLSDRGHECRVCAPTAPYARHGIHVSDDLYGLDGCDFVFTHLHRSAEARALCAHVPLVQIIHFEDQVDSWTVEKCDLTVHNTRWLARLLPREPSMVVHPPVFKESYETTPGNLVTLVNLTYAKGALFFWDLARLMPDTGFLGVKGGYGDQIIYSLPNVEVIEPVEDMREVYSRTRILLVPSLTESYGRCAIEASCSGIPTIATRTPGLVEALGEAGVYPPMRLEAWEEAIRSMDWVDRSAGAERLASSLDHEGELRRLEQALYDLAARSA